MDLDDAWGGVGAVANRAATEERWRKKGDAIEPHSSASARGRLSVVRPLFNSSSSGKVR